MVSAKSRTATFLLAFFLGTLGIHRFYVGKVGSGIVMLLLSLTVVGLFITWIWAVIDLIVALCGSFKDVEGKLITAW